MRRVSVRWRTQAGGARYLLGEKSPLKYRPMLIEWRGWIWLSYFHWSPRRFSHKQTWTYMYVCMSVGVSIKSKSMSILSQIDAGKTLSQPQRLAISKMSTYQAPASLQNKGIRPWQGVTGRGVGQWQGTGARIRAKTMRISINKEAKRRQQRQWVWLQQKEWRRGPKAEETTQDRGKGCDGGKSSGGGVIIYQTRTHKGQVKCYPCSYQGKHGRGSSGSSSCSFDVDSWRAGEQGVRRLEQALSMHDTLAQIGVLWKSLSKWKYQWCENVMLRPSHTRHLHHQQSDNHHQRLQHH